jgi:hypothetical protein
MTAREKAKELVEKYNFVYIANYTSMFEVKQCALIAVDEILNAINPFGQFLGKDYWDEVKQEIEKLC